MATYQITSPDGGVHEITAPDGASQADVLAYAQQHAQSHSPGESNFVTKAIGSGARGIAGLLDTAPSLIGFASSAMGVKPNPSAFAEHPFSDLASKYLPQHFGGLGGSLVEGAASAAPLALATGGGSLLANLGLGALSAGAGETTREMGGGVLAQLAASLLAPAGGSMLAGFGKGIINGGKAVSDVVASPERVAAGVFQAGAADPKMLAQRLLAGKAEIPGLPLTSAQATGDLGLQEQELARRSRSAVPFQYVDEKQRKMMVDALSAPTKTEAEYKALQDARTAASEPLLQSIKGTALATNDSTLENLVNRAGGLPQQLAKTVAMREGRPFMLPVQTENGAATSLADLERMNSQRPMSAPYVEPSQGIPAELQDNKLLSYIRNLGGISMSDMRDLVGERATNKSGAQVGVFTAKGEDVGDMARRLADKGVIPKTALNDVDGGAQYLRDEIQKALNPQYDKNTAILNDYYNQPPREFPQAFAEGVAPKMGESAQPVNTPWSTISGESADYLRRGINNAMNSPKEDLPALMRLKEDYSNFLGSQSPSYMEGVKTFADASAPINHADVARALYNKFVPAAEDIASKSREMQGDILSTRRNALADALRNGDRTAQTATGFGGAKMADYADLANTGNAVVSDATRIANSTRKGMGPGSPTNRFAAQNLMIGQHIINQAGVPGWLQGGATANVAKALGGALAGGVVGGVPGAVAGAAGGGTALKLLGAVAGGVAERMNTHVGDVLDRMHADPKFAAQIIMQAKIPMADKRTLMDKYFPKAASFAGGISQAAQPQ